MGDVVENYSYMNEVPNEILLYIFKFLTVKQLMTNRRVSKRWKQLLEAILADANWERHCEVDFVLDCMDVKQKSPDNLNFYDIYKCLTLWQRSSIAKENIDEFCHSTRVSDEIRDINVLKDDLIIVHRRDGIIYYNVSTQVPAPRERIYGDFNKVVEIGDTVITFDGFLHLSVLRRTETDTEDEEYLIEKVFNNVKYFIVANNIIYFINMSNEIFSYAMTEKDSLPTNPLVRYQSDSQRLVSMSAYNGQLHGLWIDRRVRVYQNNEFVTLFSLDNEPNMLHILWKYQFIENIDWRIYYIWMTQLRHNIPNGPLNFICTLRVYGDVFFVGSQCGVLRVYYKPFKNGELDLFNSKPIREYNFSHRIDIPILSVHPILKIEIVEIRNGHKILVAMPRKILVINLIHDTHLQVSKALVPYTDWKSIIFKECNTVK